MDIPTTKLPLNALTPHPENYNQHPGAQIKELAESLTTFGQFKNIVCWTCPENLSLGNGQELHEGVCYILAGHGLWLAAMEAGIDELEVKDYTGLSYEMALSLLMIDNAAPLGSEPIPEKLSALMAKTRAIVADKPGLQAMLAKLKEQAGLNGGAGEGGGGETEPQPLIDKAEELQKVWQVKPGDIWQIADHFIICGDCRESGTWKQLLAAARIDKINGVFTSPPYAEQRKKQYGGVPTAEYVEWWEAVQANVRANLAGDGSFFVNIKPHSEDKQRVLYVFDLVCAMVRRWQWRFIDELSWKHQGVPTGDRSHGKFKNGFEPIFHFAIGKNFKWFPDNVSYYTDKMIRYDGTLKSGRHPNGTGAASISAGTVAGYAWPSNVIEIALANNEAIHGAAFPVALPTFFIRAYSDPGDSWLDPFAGSGTVAVAAHNEGRVAFMVEQLPKYCAVILERLKGVTGQEPKLINST